MTGYSNQRTRTYPRDLKYAWGVGWTLDDIGWELCDASGISSYKDWEMMKRLSDIPELMTVQSRLH